MLVLSLSYTMLLLMRFRHVGEITECGMFSETLSVGRKPVKNVSQNFTCFISVRESQTQNMQHRPQTSQHIPVKRLTKRRSNKTADSLIQMSLLFFRLVLLHGRVKHLILTLGA